MKTKFNTLFEEILTTVKSKFMLTELNALKQSVTALHTILSDYNINYVIIGGIAIEEYGYARFTEDIDILVNIKDKQKLLNIPPGFIQSISDRTFYLHEPKIKVEVLYSGDYSGAYKVGIQFLSPDKLLEYRNGIPFLTLPHLIEYKLSAGLYGKNRKYKDFNDVITLIQKHKLPRTLGITYKFREDLNTEYIKLFDEIKK